MHFKSNSILLIRIMIFTIQVHWNFKVISISGKTLQGLHWSNHRRLAEQSKGVQWGYYDQDGLRRNAAVGVNQIDVSNLIISTPIAYGASRITETDHAPVWTDFS